MFLVSFDFSFFFFFGMVSMGFIKKPKAKEEQIQKRITGEVHPKKKKDKKNIEIRSQKKKQNSPTKPLDITPYFLPHRLLKLQPNENPLMNCIINED